MPKKESRQKDNRQTIGKTIVCCAMAALGVYVLLQFVNAALVSGEVIGEEKAWTLVWVSAGFAVLLGVLVLGRKCRTQRMLLGFGSALVFDAVLAALTLASGNSLTDAGGPLVGVLAASLVGGLLAALAAGGKKGHRGRRR